MTRVGAVALAAACAALALDCSRPSPPPEPSAAVQAQYAEHKARFFRLHGAGDLPAALEEARAAVRLLPRVEEPYVWTSKLSTDLGRDREAVAFFDEIAATAPDSPWPWFYKGFQHVHLSEPEPALAAFERAAQIAPDHAESFYRQGVILQGEGRFDGAVIAYRKALALDPDSAPKVARLAEVLERTGGEEEAISLVKAALGRGLDSFDLRLIDARGELRAGRPDAAAEAFRRAVILDTRDPRPQQGLATALLRTGDDAGAARAQAAAKRLEEYQEARKTMRGYLARTKDPAVPLLLGEIELTERNFAEALIWFRRAESMGFVVPRVLAGRAEACFGSGDFACGDDALAKLAGRGEGRAELAQAARLVATGDREAARRAIDRAVETGPNEREFLRRAADLEAAIGHSDVTDRLLAQAASAPRASTAPGSY